MLFVLSTVLRSNFSRLFNDTMSETLILAEQLSVLKSHLKAQDLLFSDFF